MSWYSKNFDYTFTVLTGVGFLNLNTRNSYKKNFYYVFQSFMLLFIFLFNVLEYIDLYVVRSDLEKFNFNLCSSVTTTVCLVKTLRNLYILPEISKLRRDLLKDAEKEKDGESKAILLKAAMEMRFLNKLFYGMTYSLLAVWLSAPLLDYRSGERTLPFRQWFPFDIQSSPNYELAYVYQVLSCLTLGTTIISSDLFCFGFLIQISAEYKIVEKILTKLNIIYEEMDEEKWKIDEELRNKKTWDVIRNAIQHHQQVVLRIKKFEDNFRASIGFQFLGCTLLLAIIGFDVTVVSTEFNARFLTQLGYLGTGLVDLFFYCLYGTRVQNKSYELVETTFNTPWFVMDPRFRMYLSFIIMRAQNPPLITGGGLLYINFNAFLKVLRTTYNMLALFRQVASKNKTHSKN